MSTRLDDPVPPDPAPDTWTHWGTRRTSILDFDLRRPAPLLVPPGPTLDTWADWGTHRTSILDFDLGRPAPLPVDGVHQKRLPVVAGHLGRDDLLDVFHKWDLYRMC